MKSDRDKWLNKVLKDKRLSDKEVAELVKIYRYLKPSRQYEVGPRLLVAADSEST
jgi:hypothetical protein